jgi:hypothetical protein
MNRNAFGLPDTSSEEKNVTATLPIIELDPLKGRPTVEVIFGQAHLGTYRVFLWDAQGKNPEPIGHGNNIDDVLDDFSAPRDPGALDKTILSYEAIVQAAEPREGQLYSLTITVRQQGKVCTGGVIQETGTFNDVKSIIGFRRFES